MIDQTQADTRLGRLAYNAYGAAVGWRTQDDRPMPPWFDLTERVQSGWIAAGQAARTLNVSRETSTGQIGNIHDG